MKTKAPWILLCVSIAFNALFIAGFLRAWSHSSHRCSFEDRAQWISERLDLDPDQQVIFNQLLEETIENRTQFRQAKHAWKSQLVDELVKDEPDPAVLEAFVKQDHHKGHRELMVQQIGRLMAILRPQQRQTLQQLLKDRWKRKLSRHSMNH
jgi:Spy/CpxP family protein refolding chaperone